MDCVKPGVCPPVSPIICEPIVIVREHFIPQIVPVIHPIKVVDKVHCVPVKQHVVTCTRDGVGTGNVTVSSKSQKKRPARISRARNKQ
ncbi:hypothetical protein [Paenibacillus faecalis]|uniref:hypothetical protein n=1 Tax=Paenibacillus faecalis TaxID=2079532 RepID=UPI000D11127F|nr:hypothetical protein [Paenibacillus faecalis]